ncbi:MAG: allantoicase [Hamadaea sp.]|nr:allantoicase [Hamadaea sp.]
MNGFEHLTELSARRMGGGVVAANDEFFGAADHLVADHEPAFAPATFGPKGQIYDGWETRRRREAGHDHAIVRLGAAGQIHGVVVDTAHFLGNYPPEISVEACGMEGYPSPSDLQAAVWTTIVPRSPVRGGQRNAFRTPPAERYTHVRLSIYPDGGVARLHVHGVPLPDPRLLGTGACDLAAAEFGAIIESTSDSFYGSAANLLLPGQATTMGEGWETARRRDGGHEWAVVQLAAPGRIGLAEIDTTHYKGNAPGACALHGANARLVDLADESAWLELMPMTRLQPDTRHRFVVARHPAVTHVRLSTYPDGGVARLRLPGRIARADMADLGLRWFNALPEHQAEEVLAAAGRSLAMARNIVARRPLTDPALLPQTARGCRVAPTVTRLYAAA